MFIVPLFIIRIIRTPVYTLTCLPVCLFILSCNPPISMSYS